MEHFTQLRQVSLRKCLVVPLTARNAQPCRWWFGDGPRADGPLTGLLIVV